MNNKVLRAVVASRGARFLRGVGIWLAPLLLVALAHAQSTPGAVVPAADATCVASALNRNTTTRVHANNVFDVFSRFTHMGLEPYALVSALNGIWAQRLIRLNCQRCARPYVADGSVTGDLDRDGGNLILDGRGGVSAEVVLIGVNIPQDKPTIEITASVRVTGSRGCKGGASESTGKTLDVECTPSGLGYTEGKIKSGTRKYTLLQESWPLGGDAHHLTLNY